ncbi:MAG: peptidylprolyl isomerase [Anaerolineae bacterium]|nr:peptidylprolyl isomerase [Anaerolineae bacterium]
MVDKRWLRLALLLALATMVLLAAGCGSTPTATPTGEAPAGPVVLPTAGTPQPRVDATLALSKIDRLDGATLARVNGEAVTWADYEPVLRQVLFQVTKQYQIDWGDPAMEVRLKQFQQDVLTQAVDRRLLWQVAAEQGVTVTDAEVQAQLEQDKQRVLATGANADWDSYLAANGLDANGYARLVKDNLLVNKLVAIQQVEEEGEQVHLAYIGFTDESLGKAIVQELKAGRDFAELAKLYSDDPDSKEKGGDIGWFAQGGMPADIEQVAWSLESGQYSEVIKGQSSYFIIKVIERGMQPLDEQALLLRQQQALVSVLEEAKASASIEYLVNFIGQ